MNQQLFRPQQQLHRLPTVATMLGQQKLKSDPTWFSGALIRWQHVAGEIQR
jgi:hypothetical protein